jgi:hypothetical protein
MPYSLQQAASACGINRSTVLRSIKAGRISASKNELGEWQIEPAELHRVYPAVAPATERPEAAQHDAGIDALVAELRDQLAEMRAQRDAWQSVAERLALAAPKPAEKPVTWWKWLRTSA